MLVWNRGEIEHRQFLDLPGLLRPGDHLVFNDTRVIPAMLTGVRRRTGGAGGEVETGPAARISINLDRRIAGGSWRVFAKPARRLRAGDLIEFGAGLTGKALLRDGDHFDLEFNCRDDEFQRRLDLVGSMPLPPYINSRRDADERDRDDYQTIFARRPGAVAAPTASLHFDSWLLDRLHRCGIGHSKVTLHVGAGTFLPIRGNDIASHIIHAEWGEISAAAAAEINRARDLGGRVIPVGTTALRLVETAARDGRVDAWRGNTDLFIRPGHRFQMSDGLMTNFHLPRSTLILLVAAYLGTAEMQRVYRTAIDNRYRFYSYGDGSLLLRR